MIDNTFIEAVQATGAALVAVRSTDGIRPYMVNSSQQVVPVADELLAKPWRLAQKVNTFEPQSFTHYFTDYCNEDSRIFVDGAAPAIVGVIDYHKAVMNEADWAQHRVHYVFRHTDEWKAWSGLNAKPLPQAVFAQFIEDNLPDIISPNHADMLELSRTLEAKKNVNFSSAVRLQTSEVQFIYQEEIRGTASNGTIDIPEKFKIEIAPYEGSAKAIIDCRFRYSLKEGALTVRYEMVRPQKVLDAAILAVVEQIRQGVSNPITMGTI